MLKSFLSKKKNLSDDFTLKFWAIPLLDTDVTRLFTQTYAQYMGLARWNLLFNSEFRDAAFKRGWAPVTTKETITYKRSIRAFDRVRLVTRILHWNDRRFYIEHIFYVKDQKKAIAFVEGLVKGPKGDLTLRYEGELMTFSKQRLNIIKNPKRPDDEFQAMTDIWKQLAFINAKSLQAYLLTHSSDSSQVIFSEIEWKELFSKKRISAACSDDFHFNGMTVHGSPNKHFHIEYLKDHIVIYHEKEGRDKGEILDWGGLEKQVFYGEIGSGE